MSQTCLSNNKTTSLRLRHLRHAHVPANCLSSPHPRLDAMQNRGIETELGEPVSKRSWANQYLKKSETPPDPLGEPVLKKNSETPPDPLGESVLKKNPKPLQTRWALSLSLPVCGLSMIRCPATLGRCQVWGRTHKNMEGLYRAH